MCKGEKIPVNVSPHPNYRYQKRKVGGTRCEMISILDLVITDALSGIFAESTDFFE